ncbi:MAG: DUF4159 domain-containing protein [Thermoguttaceae bacterium]|jgi:hypothetical protein
MNRRIAVAAVLGVLLGPMVTILRADLTPEEVRDGIDRAVAYLKQQQQRPQGSWPDYIGQPGGVTALCTLALLNAGVDVQDEAMQRALANLRKFEPAHTYVTSLQTMVLCRAEPARDQVRILKNVKWLESQQIKTGPRRGAWSYPLGNGDGSNTQFALLALYEAERAREAGLINAEVQVSAETWRRARTYWENAQNPDGSWGYYTPMEGTGSMTCAGISSMIITADMIHQADARAIGDRIDCCGKGDVENDRIERALGWLGRNFSVTGNPNQIGQTWLLYYLYGVERAGRLTARRFIGGHDWYREGTDWLLRQQDRLSGYWKGVGHSEDDEHIATSLALLFLSKGRRPVLLAKLRHGPGEDWNQHRNDVTNLTMYVESRWKRNLTWQVIDLESAGVDDLLQAPVLYLCGNRVPLPQREDQQREIAQKLRDYLDRGGFLFAEGYCGGEGFDQGFRELVTLIFPEPEYRLKLLDSAHPIWHAEEKVAPEWQRPLLGIDFGCRTSVVYAPPDPPHDPRPSLSCLWELSRSGRHQVFSAAVQAQIDAARSIGINVLAYATNREVLFKEQIPQNVAEGKNGDQVERGKLYLAKLRHLGGCDSAPRALVNLMEAAGRELKIRTDPHPALIDITDPALFNFHLVFMHGRTSFSLTDKERKQLRTYVERGGILFADSICASKAFTKSFHSEMEIIFPGPSESLKPIPVDDPIWSTKYGGFDLSLVSRRDPQPGGGDGPLKAAVRKVPPELEGVRLGDHYGVIFSKFDLSCALEKHDSLECRGYTREDAARIGLNVLMYSLQ